jgi:hypothetical protein
MSSRPRVLTTVRIPTYGGSPPNAYKPEITVEVRAAWPPLADPDAVEHAILAAAHQAVALLATRIGGDVD